MSPWVAGGCFIVLIGCDLVAVSGFFNSKGAPEGPDEEDSTLEAEEGGSAIRVGVGRRSRSPIETDGRGFNLLGAAAGMAEAKATIWPSLVRGGVWKEDVMTFLLFSLLPGVRFDGHASVDDELKLIAFLTPKSMLCLLNARLKSRLSTPLSVTSISDVLPATNSLRL